MKDFNLVDIYKNDNEGNFIFFLAFLSAKCSQDGILFEKKYSYKNYAAYFLNNKKRFSNCSADLIKIIEKRIAADSFKKAATADCEILIKEFDKRCISLRTGQKESWSIMLLFLALLFLLFFVPLIFNTKYFFIGGIAFFLICVSGTYLYLNIISLLIIRKRIKSFEMQLKYFPAKTGKIFEAVDIFYKDLTRENTEEITVNEDLYSQEEKEILNELVEEKQLEYKNGKYYLRNPVKAFLDWKKSDPIGQIYDDDLTTGFISKNILQENGKKISKNTIYQAKSRNKENEKEFLD